MIDRLLALPPIAFALVIEGATMAAVALIGAILYSMIGALS